MKTLGKLVLFLIVIPFIAMIMLSNQVRPEDKFTIGASLVGLAVLKRYGFFTMKKVDA